MIRINCKSTTYAAGSVLLRRRFVLNYQATTSSADSATFRRSVLTTNQQRVRRSLRLAAGFSKSAALTGTAKRDPSSLRCAALRCSRYKRLEADPSSGQLLALCRDEAETEFQKEKTNSQTEHKCESPLASTRRELFEVRGVLRQQRREILRRCAAPAECVWKQIPRRREKSARSPVGMTT